MILVFGVAIVAVLITCATLLGVIIYALSMLGEYTLRLLHVIA